MKPTDFSALEDVILVVSKGFYGDDEIDATCKLGYQLESPHH